MYPPIILNKGDNIVITEYTTKYNTNRRLHKKISGSFIKDYGQYFQIYDKFKIRRTINKYDVIKVERITN